MINLSRNKVVKSIGASSTLVGIVVIQVPCKCLYVIIAISIVAIKENVQTLLSMREIVDSCMKISRQRKCVSVEERRDSLTMCNYFLIDTLYPADVRYTLYREHDFQTLQANLVHPSVRALQMLHGIANG